MLTGASLHVYVYSARSGKCAGKIFWGFQKIISESHVPVSAMYLGTATLTFGAQTILRKMLKVQVPRYCT